jgi:hypothetical protein
MVGGAIGDTAENGHKPMTRWPAYCGAHPDLYNMTGGRRAKGRMCVGGELCERKHVCRTMSSYDPAGNNALSSASVMKREERDPKEREQD